MQKKEKKVRKVIILKEQNLQDSQEHFKSCNIYIIRITEVEEKKVKQIKIFEVTMVENFLKLMRVTKSHIQVSQRTSNNT